MDQVTLVCPPGASDYPIAFGIDAYKPFRADHLDPASEWLVTMPRDAADHKLRVGGFRLARMNIGPLSSGESVRLVDKDGGSRSCGWNGMNFAPDEDGVLEVPAEAASVLEESFDFRRAPPKEAIAKKEAEPQAASKVTAEPKAKGAAKG